MSIWRWVSSILRPFEEARIGPNATFKLFPPLFKCLERDDLDASGTGRAAEAREEVEGVFDYVLRQKLRGRLGSVVGGGGLVGGDLLDAGEDRLGRLNRDANHDAGVAAVVVVVVVVGIAAGVEFERGAFFACADAAEELEVWRLARYGCSGDVGGRGEVNCGCGVGG